VAVAATILGSSVGEQSPPKDAGFGTAPIRRPSRVTARRRRHSSRRRRISAPFQVIENVTYSIPGSINTYQLRSQDVVAFGGPMLSLIMVTIPRAPRRVAVTHGVASAFHLSIGRLESGGVNATSSASSNPQSLLDAFALVVPTGHEPVASHSIFERTG